MSSHTHVFYRTTASRSCGSRSTMHGPSTFGAPHGPWTMNIVTLFATQGMLLGSRFLHLQWNLLRRGPAACLQVQRRRVNGSVVGLASGTRSRTCTPQPSLTHDASRHPRRTRWAFSLNNVAIKYSWSVESAKAVTYSHCVHVQLVHVARTLDEGGQQDNHSSRCDVAIVRVMCNKVRRPTVRVRLQ